MAGNNLCQKMVAQRFKNITPQLSKINESGSSTFDHVLNEMDFLEQYIRNGYISFGKTNRSSDKENIDTANETVTVSEDGQPKKRGRGRPRTTNVLHEKRTDSSSTARSESPGAASLNDSHASSTSSTRSKRAAAQAVGEKMEKVKNLMGNKKLRRPTDFDDFKKPLPADVSAPPTKSRKTRSKRSAGSSTDEIEVQATTSGEESTGRSKKDCKVLVQRISTPEVRKLSNKRRSEELFDQTTSPCAIVEEPTKESAIETLREEPRSKRQKGKTEADGEVSSSESKTRNSSVQISPIINVSISAALGKAIAHSSPLTESSAGQEFHGFEVEPVVEKPTRSKRGKQQESGGSDKADVVAEKSIHIDQKVTRKTVSSTEAGSSGVEVVETETNIRSRTRVLKKANVAVEESRCNQTYTCETKEDEASIRSRTRVIKKEPDEVDATEVPRTRTRVLKKGNEQGSAEVDDDSPVVEIKPLPRTRLSQTSSQSSEDENTAKSKPTKNPQREEEEKVTPDMMKTQKKIIEVPPRSPATVKGDLVRKRVEGFEKIRHNQNQEGECSTAPRVTRQAAKIKASTEPKGKTPSSLPRPVPIPNNSAVIMRPAVEDTEKRMKEEKRIKRQAKEEEVLMKKEMILKASAEETKRKREEKNLKAAAAREAAEREKALLAARAEKEKEEKLRQIQLEKDKQKKEDMMKKKLLMQQKTREHEERRKQEEAARLARLKEQEEEHKRALAMKEREMEQQRLQKAAEQRSAEAEKAKQAKLAKVAAINYAKSKAGTSTPTPSSATNPESYEITPARDEKPLLKPKTEDDYGIDDANSSDSSEDEDNPRKQIPTWAQAQKRRRVLKMQKFLPDSKRDEFFQNNPRMPDAADIFKGFPIKKRVRTSSAVWRTPPLSSRN